MLKRKATSYIKNWYDTKSRKCLIVQGARQTGKTYDSDAFALVGGECDIVKNFLPAVTFANM